MFSDNVRSIMITISLILSSIVCVRNFIFYWKNKKNKNEQTDNDIKS